MRQPVSHYPDHDYDRREEDYGLVGEERAFGGLGISLCQNCGVNEALGAVERVLGHVELRLRGLQLRLRVGVVVGQVGDAGDIEHHAVGSDLLGTRRRLQDCRFQGDLMLLVGRQPDNARLPAAGARRRLRGLRTVIARLRGRNAGRGGAQGDSGRQQANSNGKRPHQSAISVEQVNTWTTGVLPP